MNNIAQLQNELLNTTTPGERKVIVLPQTKSLHPERDGVNPRTGKIRVAAYCRVSTTLEEQQGSYELQKRYFESMISKKDNWELVGIYGDEGKSGTTLKGRTGFLTMMDDVRAGQIDYIITKATSRFGRNNAEFIKILDELNSYGVEVLFESEGILTSGNQDRTMLQMIGVTNEHYSSTLSNNIRWSKERNKRQGKVTISYKTFLGYKKGADGKPEIVEEEAKIVRLIYELFLTGKTYKYIADYLNEHGYPTPGGKDKWAGIKVKRILTNEKYTGDVILQKTFTVDYLDKKARKNNGEKSKVIVENNHDAIIDKATFARVQELIEKRTGRYNHGTKQSPYVGKIICGDCGDYYGHRTWTSRGRIKYSIWTCNSKYTSKTAYTDNKCKSANLRQEWIEQGYLNTINQILARKTQVLGRGAHRVKKITTKLNSGEIETELAKLRDSYNKLAEQNASLKAELDFTFGDESNYDYRMKKRVIEEKAMSVAESRKELEVERKQLEAELSQMKTFLDTVADMPEKLSRFNEGYFLSTINQIVVNNDNLIYCFYNGEKIKVNIETLKKAWY